MKPFKYKTRRIARADYRQDGISRTGSGEQLSGNVQGQKASDLEERMARALDKMQVAYEFRARISSSAAGAQRLTSVKANIAGELEIDHLIENGGQVIPVLVDGEISHFMTQHQRVQDEINTDMINEYGTSMGWSPAVHVPYTELRTQEDADRVARRIVDGLHVTGYAK